MKQGNSPRVQNLLCPQIETPTLTQAMTTPAPTEIPTQPAMAGQLPGFTHRAHPFLSGGAFLIALAVLLLAPAANWPAAVLLVAVTASTLMALARQLPWQNVWLVALLIAVSGSLASVAGTLTAMPFGPFVFGPAAGAQLFKTLPWGMPLLWVVAVLNSRGVARLILRPWRKTRTYGFWLMGVTAALVMAFDLALDPFASRVKHFWIWTPTNFPVTWQGAPLVNFPGWMVVTLLMLSFITPALINKQLSKRSTPDFHPLAVWLGAVLLFGIAVAARKLWPAVALDAVLLAVVSVLAVRGGRW